MLRKPLLRLFHHSSKVAQTATTNSIATYDQAYKKLEEGLEFYQTKKQLRNLIYRPKNANTLVGKELFDETKNVKLMPKNYEGRIPLKTFGKLFSYNTTIEQLQKTESLLLNFSKTFNNLKNEDEKKYVKNFLKEEVFLNYLIISAKLNKFESSLSFIYLNINEFKPYLSTSSIQLIQILTGIFKLSSNNEFLKYYTLNKLIEKLNKPIIKINNTLGKDLKTYLNDYYSNNPEVTMTYISSLINYSNLKPHSSKFVNKEIENYLSVLKNVEIPNIENIKSDKLLKYSNQLNYLIFKTCFESLKNTKEIDQDWVKNLQNYIENYEKKFGKSKTLYDQVKNDSKFGKLVEQEEASN